MDLSIRECMSIIEISAIEGVIDGLSEKNEEK